MMQPSPGGLREEPSWWGRRLSIRGTQSIAPTEARELGPLLVAAGALPPRRAQRNMSIADGGFHQPVPTSDASTLARSHGDLRHGGVGQDQTPNQAREH
jgi:hypothetical protein